MGNIMTCKINADTTDGLKLISDTSGEVDIQDNGTTRVTVGDNIDIHGNELILDADGDTSIHADTDDQIDFKVGGTDYFKINANGNIEVGSTATSDNSIRIKSANNSSASVKFRGDGSATTGMDVGYEGDGNYYFIHRVVTDGTPIEYFRIDSSGRVYINGATAVSTSQTSWRWDLGVIYQSKASAGTHIAFRVNGNAVGSISSTTTATAYNISSDYRLKENVDYTWDATTRLKQLKPARFNFIADDTDTLVDGFIAHEVSSIVPEAITGEKDAVETWQEGEELPDGVSVGDNKLDDDGNTIPDYQGIDQSKLVPLLVKTIQELEARITALESE